jgi:hypothetical protein
LLKEAAMSANVGESGFRGVSVDRRWKSPSYNAAMVIEKKRFHIGGFKTAEEAYRAYLRFKREDAPRIRAEMKGIK